MEQDWNMVLIMRNPLTLLLLFSSYQLIAGEAGETEIDPIVYYEANREGVQLYEEGKYEKAFPLLHQAARKGFKQSQVRLGGIYLYGLGVERSDIRGLAWIGTAARNTEITEITDLYDSIWSKVPESAADQITAVIDQYVDRYGMDPTELCAQTRQAGSAISTRTCEYGDKYDTLQEVQRETEYQSTFGTRRGAGGGVPDAGFGGVNN